MEQYNHDLQDNRGWEDPLAPIFDESIRGAKEFVKTVTNGALKGTGFALGAVMMGGAAGKAIEKFVPNFAMPEAAASVVVPTVLTAGCVAGVALERHIKRQKQLQAQADQHRR